MITDMILHKYLRHLRYIDQGSIVHIDAVELALRLALDELEQSIASTPSTPPTELATLQAELERLQTAANAEVAELKQQIAELDTDNAALIRRNKELADELRTLNSNAVAVISGVVGAGLPNGYVRPSTDNNQQSPANNSLWEDPDKLIFLDDEAKDWWIGMSSGRHAWRSVPKSMQLRMVRQVLGHHDGDGPVRMIDFDAIKPDWMPSANSHTKTLGLSWQQLNDWSIEL